MGHDHNHNHIHASAGARHANRLWWAFALTAGFLVVQVVVGLTSNSLALQSDAGHMATDVLGLAMALAAITAANRSKQSEHRTFGLYRLEILAALANAVLLFGVAGYVLFEAATRLTDAPEVSSGAVLLVGTLGLAVNLVAFMLLRAGATESLNMRGAYFEVVADALGSVGVIVAAGLMWLTGWGWIDPIIGAGIGLFILPRAGRLGRDALRILLQAAPRSIDLPSVAASLAAVNGVADVHDLHVWTLTSDMEVLTAHLSTSEGADPQGVLRDARTVLADQFQLQHATLQVEPPNDPKCHELTW